MPTWVTVGIWAVAIVTLYRNYQHSKLTQEQRADRGRQYLERQAAFWDLVSALAVPLIWVGLAVAVLGVMGVL